MSRIYTVTNKKTGKVERYVRANTLNAAIRAHAHELYDAIAATTEDVFQAMQAGDFHVLDAVAPEQLALGGGSKK
jgi:hypothetical protein